MQFSSIIAIIASVAVVSAAPLAGEGGAPPMGDNSGQVCKVDQKQACCKTGSSGVLGDLLGGSCELNILGQNCADQTACCNVDASGSLLAGSCQPLVQA